MHRILIILGALLLAGCWHDAFHTSIENGTGRKIDISIHFEGKGVSPGFGDLEPGNSLNLTEEVGEIAFVEYQVDDHSCRIEKPAIAKLVSVQWHDLSHIVLRDCGKPQGNATSPN
jgi:hypothetical protein